VKNHRTVRRVYICLKRFLLRRVRNKEMVYRHCF